MITGIGRFGCSLLECCQQMRLKGDAFQVYLLVCSSISPMAVTDGGIDILNENVIKNGFVKDVYDFASFCIKIDDVLHIAHVYRSGVAQDLKIHSSCCLDL